MAVAAAADRAERPDPEAETTPLRTFLAGGEPPLPRARVAFHILSDPASLEATPELFAEDPATTQARLALIPIVVALRTGTGREFIPSFHGDGRLLVEGADIVPEAWLSLGVLQRVQAQYALAAQHGTRTDSFRVGQQAILRAAFDEAKSDPSSAIVVDYDALKAALVGPLGAVALRPFAYAQAYRQTIQVLLADLLPWLERELAKPLEAHMLEAACIRAGLEEMLAAARAVLKAEPGAVYFYITRVGASSAVSNPFKREGAQLKRMNGGWQAQPHACAMFLFLAGAGLVRDVAVTIEAAAPLGDGYRGYVLEGVLMAVPGCIIFSGSSANFHPPGRHNPFCEQTVRRGRSLAGWREGPVAYRYRLPPPLCRPSQELSRPSALRTWLGLVRRPTRRSRPSETLTSSSPWPCAPTRPARSFASTASPRQPRTLTTAPGDCGGGLVSPGLLSPPHSTPLVPSTPRAMPQPSRSRRVTSRRHNVLPI